MSQLRISLDPHVRARYQEAADAEGMTLGEWVQAALRDALRRYGPPPPPYQRDRPKARARLRAGTKRAKDQNT